MNTTLTHATVAAQPGWFLAVFTNSDGIDGVRCEQIIAWEIQRVTSPKGLVTRFPIPITAESKNTDFDCTIWGIKRPDGKFVVPCRGKPRNERREVVEVCPFDGRSQRELRQTQTAITLTANRWQPSKVFKAGTSAACG